MTLRPALAALLSAALLLASLAGPVLASSPDAVAPVDTAEGEADDFHALALLTPDPDWEQEWRQPRGGGAPHFNTSDHVEDGGRLTMLLFLSNPEVDAEGMADVACDVRVTRPDGSLSISQRDVPCFRGPPMGEPYTLYLAAVNIGFVSEPSDQRGVWVVDAALTDRLRGVSVPLRVAFDVR